ncbi:Uncharacterised protein [Serratia entomophila]|uniref:hypothetical protein n=1 Tax=Serratia entomophila TaxID=42906 RepID=UPI00217ADD21|nr:hypothetical protein [Serratia entomophila]CAI0888048.1 Uncharacterised protein [Serratia entomophila]CAI1765871.1 Uncharacterised protein [Serratia entomophila]
MQEQNEIQTMAELSDLDILAASDGYTKIGGFYQQEGNGDIGKTSSIDDVAGKRGHYDVYPTTEVPLSGAALIFGGDNYRGVAVVNNNGAMVTRLVYKGVPATDTIHHPYVIPSGRVDETGAELRVMKVPYKNGFGTNNEFEMEFGLRNNGQPRVIVRPPKVSSALGNDSLAIELADEKKFISNKSFAVVRVPSETVANTLDPKVSYIVRAGRTASGTVHLKFNLNNAEELVTAITAGQYFAYISFKKIGAPGYGLYPLVGNAQKYADGVWLHIAPESFTLEPDGTAIDSANTPGTDNNFPACGYEDIKIILSTEKMAAGVNLSDRYNGFHSDVVFPYALVKAIKDNVRFPLPYINKTIVSAVDFAANKTTSETLAVVNTGYVWDLKYNQTIAGQNNDAKNKTMTDILGQYAPYDYVFMLFYLPNNAGYSL